MKVLAFVPVRTTPSREEQTVIFHSCDVRSRKACVFFYVAAGLGFGFAEWEVIVGQVSERAGSLYLSYIL